MAFTADGEDFGSAEQYMMWRKARLFGDLDAAGAVLAARSAAHAKALGRVLVEASPLGRIWGVGLAADDPGVCDPHAWPGLNLLGFALLEARISI